MTVAERPAWVDDELFPFESQFIDIDGHHVHYVDEGSGPTLLFLHGNPTWSFDYSQIIKSLRGEFRCIAVDYPGFGLSVAAPGYRYLPSEHAEVIGKFVDALRLSGATLVAHDWGGPIGLATVQHHPDFADGWNNLAQVLLEQHKPAAASTAIAKAIALGGPRQAAYIALQQTIRRAATTSK